MTAPARRTAPDRAWMREDSPFHAGEQQVQRRVGVRDQVERAGRNMIRERMPEQHRELFEALPLLVMGSADSAGRIWASILAGEPGFVRSPSPELLQVQAQPARGDPAREHLTLRHSLGLLGIQLETRRRNRANGRIIARDAGSFTVKVEQSFGNCKQYIQAREPSFDAGLLETVGPVNVEGPHLSARARELLAGTDTFFIATASAAANSGNPGEGVDVSHRGGRPGFVHVSDGPRATVLTIPDFRGNFVFNTFGNLEVNPRAGIVCPDFRSGDLLSATGTAHVIWEGAELATFEGAQRLLRFEVESGVLLERALPLRFTGLEPSPDLAETGTWPEAERR